MSGACDRLNCEILQSDSAPWILGSVLYPGSRLSLLEGCLGLTRLGSLASRVGAGGFVDCLDSDLRKPLF